MHVVRRDSNELVVQERPILAWAVGGLFIVAGAFVALTSHERFFGLGFLLLGLATVLLFASIVTCTFSKDTRRFVRFSKGLIRSRRTEHSLDDVVGVHVEQNPSGRNPGYRIALALSSSERIPLTSSYSSGRKQKDEVASAIRDHLGLEDAGDVPIPGFGDMARLIFDSNARGKLSDMYGSVMSHHEAAIERDPDNIESRRELATALAMQNRPDEARAHLVHARGVLLRQGNARMAEQFETMIKKLDEARGYR